MHKKKNTKKKTAQWIFSNILGGAAGVAQGYNSWERQDKLQLNRHHTLNLTSLYQGISLMISWWTSQGSLQLSVTKILLKQQEKH